MCLPALLTTYIMCFSNFHEPETVENLTMIDFIAECVILSGMFIYQEVLKAKSSACENSGTDLGGLLMFPLYLCGATAALIASIIILIFL